MSFWDLSDGGQVEETKEYEAPSGGGDYIFADGTKVAAIIDECKWHSFNGGEEFLNIRWSVFAPEVDADGVKIANRKIFQKLWVNGNAERAKGDSDKIKRTSDNAKRMLSAIATNAGGGLLKVTGKPTDDDLSLNLLMKPMLIRLGVWEFNDRKGNWVQSVSPYTGSVDKPASAEKSNKVMSQGSPLDDDIPFSPCM